MTTPDWAAARTMAELIAEHARERPDSMALSTPAGTLTYAELDRVSDDYAQAMLASGVVRGDRVAMIASNGIPFVAMHFAASKIGAVLVGVNWRLSPYEVAQIFADCQPCLVLVDHELSHLLDEVKTTPETVLLSGPQSRLDEWLAAGDNGVLAGGVPDDVLLLLYTTGTTGRSKGARLTERTVNEMVRSMSQRWLMHPGMTFLAVLPLFHVSGTGCFFTTMYAGGEVIIPPDATGESIARYIADRQVTHSALVPTILNTLVHDESVRRHDLSSLRVMIYGAAPSGGTLIQDAMALMPSCGFTQGYGLTETSGGVSAAPMRRHGEVDDRPGTVGQANPNYEFRIVDPATLSAVGPGVDGEVWLRGSQNADGYWDRPEESAASFLPDGWFRTGDIGVVDEDGFLYLKDRLKDMIISGGENIYSVEVESALLAHPEILEVAVYGVPDPHWGERVKAVVVLVPGSSLSEEAVLDHARSRLARYKLPRLVEFADALPKSGSGKIIKHVLRSRDAAGA